MLVDPKRTLDRAEEVRHQADEASQASWGSAAEGATAPVEGVAYRPLEEVLEGSGRALLRLGPFDSGQASAVRIDAHAIEPYRANVTRVAADARDLIAAGSTVVLCTEGAGPAQRLVEVLREERLTVPDLAAELPPDPGPGALVGTAPLLTGFRLPSLRLALVAEGDLYGTRRQTREQARMPSSRRRAKHAGGQLALEELQPGDIVVHAVHGIGRYVGMEHRSVGGAERDYLVLAYDQGDKLYLPSEQVELISRYVGGEHPKLSRLGSREWDRQKARVRKKVREMAAELVRLYSARMASPGHAFGPDTPWQRELEDAFPFTETPDQLTAVEEIKADMEAPVPMDRLLCGDVGYGKTEVAVRAAFKAVMDGKQVGVLVPTTLLAQQHMAVFSERFAPFPVKVAVLSRFQSGQEQDDVVAGMADGTIDVVIGTHRLLSADAKWSDLGLVVVDEEHRFGVVHKEHLKQLRTEVDVLTLTATPIPRTMEMAISGIRDLSVMETPPEERHPVLTFVGAYDQGTVANAIRREMLREGQTFFVHNRVDSIDRVAYQVRQAIPEARVAVAHGQMREEQLERIMLEFLGQELRCSCLYHHHRVRDRHPQRQHPDRRPGRHPRPGPALPAQGPGRALPGAGLRLPVLPARAVHHRDLPPAAGHRRHPPGPRLGHGHRHEGPRDPRRRQPARGRPVRPRRPGRLRHVHAAAGRGRCRPARPPDRGPQGAEAGGPGRRPPPRRLRAPRAPPPGGLPPPRRGQGGRGGGVAGRRAGRPLRPTPGPGPQPPPAGRRPRPGHRRRPHRAGLLRRPGAAVPRRRPPRVQAGPPGPPLPGRHLEAARTHPRGPPPPEGTNLPTWLCELLTGVLGAPAAPTLPETDRPEHRRAAS